MQCKECEDYKTCSTKNDLRKKRSRCHKAKELRRATNEEMLRILRGEKLAEFLYKNEGVYCVYKPECAVLLDKDIEIQESACKKCMLEWLKKEANQ